ncbi:hypothetical protein J4232_03955 [Candidatus Woesearchaeota archaeon]|nr:hypothetical protein [Candidatus Woesearchaeota archaeon]
MYIDDDFIKEGQKMVLVTYSTKKLTNSNKIRFYYALKGRDGKSGIVKDDHIKHLGKTVLLVPYKFADDIKQFMQQWNLPYTFTKIIAGNTEAIGTALEK